LQVSHGLSSNFFSIFNQEFIMGSHPRSIPRHLAMLALATALGGGALASAMASVPARAGEHWITSWYAAPQAGWDNSFPLPMQVPAYLDNQSLRDTVRLSAGGHRIRLVFSNRYGREPVTIGQVRVRLADGAQPGQTLTFSGNAAVAILPGATATSDPVAVRVPALARLVVTSWLPARTAVTSFHWGAQQTIQVMPGNATTGVTLAAGAAVEGRIFLSAVLVDAGEHARTVVALGDSITDGNGSTPDADRRWPDFLAQRLAPHGIAVANAGISGARLARDGMGQSALARFEQDVLGQPGISDVIVLLGINDIGWPGSPFAPAERAATLDELTAAYRQLVAAAHARRVRVTAGTLPPFEGALEGTPYAGHYSVAKERLRNALNDWLRTAGIFDGVVDFDAVLRDPGRPGRLRAGFDSGDHLHPGDAGYRAMAAAIDTSSLLRRADRNEEREARAVPGNQPSR
jgi:lysophospholipase L1-like esterase